MKLKDRVALVTGVSVELAKSVALEFLREGAIVVFVDKDENELKEIEKGIQVSKDKYFLYPADLTKEADINALVKAILKKYGTLNILVNNEGDVRLKPFIASTDEDFDFAIDMILRPNIWLTKAVIPIMQKNNYGKIINSACIGGKIGIPNGTNLCMCRHAIIGLTKSLAVEMGSYSINVNAVISSVLETKTTKKRMIPNIKDASKMIQTGTPLGRMASTKEISRLYVFLASDDAGYMTGQAINFTGGFLMF